MKKANIHYMLNNPGFILFLIKTPKSSLINMMKLISKNKKNEDLYQKINNNTPKLLENKEFLDSIINKDSENRIIKQMTFLYKEEKENLLHNTCLDDKIIIVEGLKVWEKYGVLKNNYSCHLFDEIMKININDKFFSFQKKVNKILADELRIKFKKICNNQYIGSAIFCGLFFNKEFNKMISVSVGNILYSILRENSREKYEIIYISTGQYHDINIPYQLSSFNQDYNYLDIRYHNIKMNDIFIIANNKQTLLNYIDKINSKTEDLYNLENNCYYLAKYKLIEGQISILTNDSISISSTTNSNNYV